jgi:hypothetical protein
MQRMVAFLFGLLLGSKAYVLDCSSQLNPKSIDFRGYKSEVPCYFSGKLFVKDRNITYATYL